MNALMMVIVMILMIMIMMGCEYRGIKIPTKSCFLGLQKKLVALLDGITTAKCYLLKKTIAVYKLQLPTHKHRHNVYWRMIST